VCISFREEEANVLMGDEPFLFVRYQVALCGRVQKRHPLKGRPVIVSLLTHAVSWNWEYQGKESNA
jgi:hypothetical protein